MNKLCIVLLLNVFIHSAFSQKADVLIKDDSRIVASEWQLLDEQHIFMYSEAQFPGADSIILPLVPDRRYYFQVSVPKGTPAGERLYSIRNNGDLILAVVSENEPGDYVYSFVTGSRDQGTKIIGGSSASISDFPWQVLFRAASYYCGGTIIGSYWILTAAHCTQTQNGGNIAASEMSVKAGTNDPFNPSEGRTYNVSRVYRHPYYDRETLANDIAILSLTETINYPNAVPIRLVNADNFEDGAIDPGVMSWVTGWGVTNPLSDIPSTYLNKVQLPIVSRAQAEEVWQFINGSNIIAGYPDGNKASCFGDSGGPLVVPVGNEYRIGGIVSWGSQYCDTYGGYTKVPIYESWIRTVTGIKDFKPSVPAGSTLMCAGTASSQYTVDPYPGASAYEWEVIPAGAGTLSWVKQAAAITWDSLFYGSARIRVRVLVSGKYSDWSRLDVIIAQKTKIVSQSGNVSACEDDSVALEVNTEGYDLKFKWYLNGNLTQAGQTGILSIPRVPVYSSGTYQCNITGTCGSATANAMTLSITPKTYITYITPDIKAEAGKEVILEVAADGKNLSYQWFKDDVLIENATNGQMLLTGTNYRDIGLYKILVAGECGSQVSDPVYVYIDKDSSQEESRSVLWPNITNGPFRVAVSNDEEYDIDIFTLGGAFIKTIPRCHYETEATIEGLPVGIYIVKVRFKNTYRSFTVIKS